MRILLLCCWVFVGLLLTTDAYSQRASQYKRVHQRALKQIIEDQSDAAIAELIQFSEKFPDDAETYFMLAVAHARKGQVDEAIAHVRNALERGLPKGRVVGGSLTGLETLKHKETFQALVQDAMNQLAHGPMLGQATGDGMSIWVRTPEAADVQAFATPTDGEGNVVRSQIVRTIAERSLERLQGIHTSSAVRQLSERPSGSRGY